MASVAAQECLDAESVALRAGVGGRAGVGEELVELLVGWVVLD